MDERWEPRAIVIGTGFGGAVTACRLVEAGIPTLVLERGRRYTSRPAQAGEEPESDLPRLPPTDRVLPDMHRWSWEKDQGLWDMAALGGITSLQGAGYGGGSLVYANVHLRAPESVFERQDEARGRLWPAWYTSDHMEAYYDRVAAMLDINPITEAPFHPLVKTDQMQKVATELGRDAAFFFPPLAVSFTDKPDNGFGRPQSGCRACGECDTGCRYRAKNTLDLNYLARVEDSSPVARVRTQAEVVMISEIDEGRYEVTYVDHLRGNETVRVESDYVFLCAGAVRSTELLLRAKAVGRPRCDDEQTARRWRPHPDYRGLPRLDPHDNLGERYYANADALGMIYDTQLPGEGEHGRKRQTLPTVGPVITTALSHQAGADSWFLLEEGGFPKALARHAGIMRAPLWLRRNRHVHHGAEGPPHRIHRVDPSARPANVPTVPEPTGLAGIGGIEDGPHPSVLDTLYRLLERRELAGMVPEQARSAASALFEEFRTYETRELGELVLATRNQLRFTIVDDWFEQHPRTTRLLERLGLFDSARNAGLAILRVVFGWVEAAHLRQASITTFEQRYDVHQPVRLAGRVAKALTAFHDDDHAHSERSMVLLAMGRDPTAGTLSLQEGALTCELPIRQGAATLTHEESLMRDVAAALGGKLRVNPLWAFARMPVTVHSQGGCAMSERSRTGVTDEWGQVWAHPGLVVLDGSILPTPVGVNPASTIAAVAERNVEHHIEQMLGAKPDAPPYLAKRVDAWKSRDPGTWALEPRFMPQRRPPVAEPIGIRFEERMTGFLAPPERWRVGTFDPPAHEALEYAGRRVGSSVVIDLQAHIPDVVAFVRDPQHLIRIRGSVTFAGFGNDDGEFQIHDGRLYLLDQAGASNRMKYELTFHAWNQCCSLEGVKRLRDDPGPDAIWDTTALFTELLVGGPHARYAGIAHVGIDYFGFQQMPSFHVTGTDDPARRLWALTTFGAYFFGGLQRVYAPELQRAIDALMRMEIR